jgi:hypothetical protein
MYALLDRFLSLSRNIEAELEASMPLLSQAIRLCQGESREFVEQALAGAGQEGAQAIYAGSDGNTVGLFDVATDRFGEGKRYDLLVGRTAIQTPDFCFWGLGSQAPIFLPAGELSESAPERIRALAEAMATSMPGADADAGPVSPAPVLDLRYLPAEARRLCGESVESVSGLSGGVPLGRPFLIPAPRAEADLVVSGRGGAARISSS